jgi:hypothetical protein
MSDDDQRLPVDDLLRDLFQAESADPQFLAQLGSRLDQHAEHIAAQKSGRPSPRWWLGMSHSQDAVEHRNGYAGRNRGTFAQVDTQPAKPRVVQRILRGVVDVAGVVGLLAVFAWFILIPALQLTRPSHQYFEPVEMNDREVVSDVELHQPIIVNGETVYRNLTLEEAESVAAFPLYQPDTVLMEWRFNGIVLSQSGAASASFYRFGLHGQELRLWQVELDGASTEDLKYPIGPDVEVQSVEVNGTTGEYVEGDRVIQYVIMPYSINDELGWQGFGIVPTQGDEPEIRLLRWEQDGFLFSLIAIGLPSRFSDAHEVFLDQNVLIEIAGSLK